LAVRCWSYSVKRLRALLEKRAHNVARDVISFNIVDFLILLL
jgi:hypothetical protein